MAANKNRFTILSMHLWVASTATLPASIYTYNTKIFHFKDTYFLPLSKNIIYNAVLQLCLKSDIPIVGTDYMRLHDMV